MSRYHAVDRSRSVHRHGDEVGALDDHAQPRRAACSGGGASARCRPGRGRTPCGRPRCRTSRPRTRRPSPRAPRAPRRRRRRAARCAPSCCGANSQPELRRLADPEARVADPELALARSRRAAGRASRRRTSASASSRWTGRRRSRRSDHRGDPANGALHLQLDQPVHLDRVLERELLGDRLDEAGDDHRGRLRLGEPARHQVEELLLADLRDGRLVADVDVVLVDPDVRIGVGARLLVEDQRVADDLRLRAVRALARPRAGRGSRRARRSSRSTSR